MRGEQLDLLEAAARPRLADERQRRRIRAELDATLFVEAAAGTGKTTELVRRIIGVLRSGQTTLGKMVALTFTEKAAGELKLRLREEIERERQASRGTPTQRCFDVALAELEAAPIGTIHSFCAELLRERPVEARVDPLFETLAEDQAARLLDEAFGGWFERVLDDPPEGVRRLLRRRASGRDRFGPRQLLRQAVQRLADHRDFRRPWRREALDRAAAIDGLVDRLAQLADLAPRAALPQDWLARSLQDIARFVDELRIIDAGAPGGGRDHDGLEARLRELARARCWEWKGRPAKYYAPGVTRDAVLAQRDAVRVELQAQVERADADLAACLHADLEAVVDAYELLKARSGRLDFLDLLLDARDLVRGDRGLRAVLQQRYTHFFVDEFQDTDPLQVDLLLLLAAADPQVDDWRAAQSTRGKLFLVGDPKQSIYRFRRADVALYERVKQHLGAQGAAMVPLEASFRAVPALQAAINAAFGEVMHGDAGHAQASYVALKGVRPDPDPDTQPALVALPVPRPYGWRGKITKAAIEESYPDAVGAFISWLVGQSGWTVTERGRPETRVPVEPRHICLLFRRFSSWGGDLTRAYVRALEARRVPHVVVGGHSFHDREEVLATRNALAALEWPDDELVVYATLRGPFFALGDDQLLVFRQRWGRLHPLRRHDPAALPAAEREVAEALELLGGLHPGRNRRPISSTLLRLLEGVRAHAGLATWPTGEQALANVLQLVDRARRFEAAGNTSFRAFVDSLAEAAARGEAQEAPVVEEGTEGVRMMTVHKAKGLEFPVVILVDPTSPLPSSPSRHVDTERGLWAEPLANCSPRDLLEQRQLEQHKDEQEELRLAYVAATRARDLLVVPVIGDEQPRDTWLSALNPVVYPPLASQRRPGRAPACPTFGSESVLDRPADADAPPGSSVAPGAHRPRLGGHSVVWWDPAALTLGVEHQLGLRQQRLLDAAEHGAGVEEGRAAFERWQAERAEVLASGAAPSLCVDSVTATTRVVSAPEVELCVVPGDRARRPAGLRFGTLVHATLAAVDLAAGAEAVRALAEVHGRMIGAPLEEVEAAARAALAALAHPLLRRAAASSDLRRETPVLLRRADGSLVEGIVDLAFCEAAEAGRPAWTVVDFKTDEEALPEYHAQVRLYMEAIAQATGQGVRGVLLLV